jgi:hypothetical protein
MQQESAEPEIVRREVHQTGQARAENLQKKKVLKYFTLQIYYIYYKLVT